MLSPSNNFGGMPETSVATPAESCHDVVAFREDPHLAVLLSTLILNLTLTQATAGTYQYQKPTAASWTVNLLAGATIRRGLNAEGLYFLNVFIVCLASLHAESVQGTIDNLLDIVREIAAPLSQDKIGCKQRLPRLSAEVWIGAREGWGYSISCRSRMAVDPRIHTLPRRKTSGRYSIISCMVVVI